MAPDGVIWATCDSGVVYWLEPLSEGPSPRYLTMACIHLARDGCPDDQREQSTKFIKDVLSRPKESQSPEQRLAECTQTVEAGLRRGVWYKIGAENKTLVIVAGREFFNLAYDQRKPAVEAVNCLLMQGKGGAIPFDVLHWQTGKVIGRFSGWDFKVY
jgi:hypothetical protein